MSENVRGTFNGRDFCLEPGDHAAADAHELAMFAHLVSLGLAEPVKPSKRAKEA